MVGHVYTAAIRSLTKHSPAPFAAAPPRRHFRVLHFPEPQPPRAGTARFKSIATTIMVFASGVFAGYFWAMAAFGLWPVVFR